MDIGAIWAVIALNPMTNGVIWLSSVLFGSLGLAIIVLTFVVRGVMYPLTLKQVHATRAMQALQPKLAVLQKKYAKDRKKLGQEQMQLYRESGVSPAGCLLPMLIQMPIWIALYQAIIRVVGVTPEDFLNLSQRLYSWPALSSGLPLDNQFLWMNLSLPDFFLALLVGGTMWLQQKMITPVTADPKQQAQGRMMLVMMPLMFTFFSLSFASGLALYWVASNIITIGIQYFVTGWGGLEKFVPAFVKKTVVDRDKKYKKRIAEVEAPAEGVAVEADIVEKGTAQEEGVDYERGGDERRDRGGGYPTRSRKAGRRARGGRGHRRKRR